MSIVAWMAFVSPLASTMIAPAALQVGAEFHFESAVIRTFITSLFLLGYVVRICKQFKGRAILNRWIDRLSSGSASQ